MTSIMFNCPFCKNKLMLDKNSGGRKIKCSKCGGIVTPPKPKSTGFIPPKCPNCGIPLGIGPHQFDAFKGSTINCLACNEAVNILQNGQTDQVPSKKKPCLDPEIIPPVATAKRGGDGLTTCANCGRRLGSQSKHCIYCGANHGRQCPKCRLIAPVDAEICVHCKTPIPPSTPNFVVNEKATQQNPD